MTRTHRETADSADATVMSRRQVIGAGTTLIAASLITGTGARPLLAATAANTFKVGEAEMTVLSDGRFTLPLSFVLPGRDEADVVKLFATEGLKFSTIVAETNVTIVKHAGRTVLIDTGAGPDFMPTLGKLTENLEAAGIKAASVTDVVFTHAHADHFWGVLDPFGDESLFANARHVMSDHERNFWLSAGVESRVPDMQKQMAVGIVRRLKQLGDRIGVVKGDAEIAPGISLFPTPGHTPGHVSVAVRSKNEELVVVGDALTQSIVSFAAPGWRWGADMDADAAIATRNKLLDRLTADKSRIVGYHFPAPGIGRVEKVGSAYRFRPA
ncbi:MAG: MBL fold metallo-hydrolase [Hyphomicrobiaceae bacterium]